MRFQSLLLGLVVLAHAPLNVLAQENEPLGDPHEAIVKDMLSVLEQITETLKTVTDPESAAAARPTLQKVAAQWEQVRKKADVAKPPSKAVRDKLEGYTQKFIVAQKQLFAQISRVISVPGGREVLREVRAVLSPLEKSKQP